MSHVKVLVLPSEWGEAFARAFVEAVFNGKVCIGSEAGDSKELAEKLEMVLNADETQYNFMFIEQRETMSHYRRESVAEEWKQLIENTVAKR